MMVRRFIVRNMIFHHPLPLNPNATSASGIRPVKMLAAFKELGYNVDLVTGYSSERQRCIKKIKENLNNGVVYDFVYSESSTMPTILTDRHHLPLHPLLDWHFFSLCKKNNIPIGLFYRDIYWLFGGYGSGINPLKKVFAKLAYRFDLWVYKRTLDTLYLPSIKMGDYVPYIAPSTFKPLPPGHDQSSETKPELSSFSDRQLKLFYVGGMSDHYQMHELFSAVANLKHIELTICTRKDEWLSVKAEYPEITDNIHIVHLSGQEMEESLQSCDIALLFVKPQEYREFASPVKLYEYLGHKKPIIATQGTLAGQFVAENGVGWSLPYDQGSLVALLNVLIEQPDLFIEVKQKLEDVASEYSWKARAFQVVKDFSI